MASPSPGAPVTPTRLRDLTFNELTFDPDTPGSANSAIDFGAGYVLYRDAVDVFGAAGDRLWLDTPDNGDVIIGPRSGAAAIGNLRLRTDATTGSAANMFINSSTYQVSRSTSSRKYKENIRDAELDLRALLKMRPVEFHDKKELRAWEARRDEALKERNSFDEPEPDKYIGFIAEELDELGLRQFVQYDERTGEADSIQYDRLTVGLLALVKDLTARVEALEGK